MRPMGLFVSLVAACGTDVAPSIPPFVEVSLHAGRTLRITTAPLALEVIAPDGSRVVERDRFVEIGVVDEIDPVRYYDPAEPPEEVRFEVPQAATAWDEETRTLTIAPDVTLTLIDGVGFAVDAPGAVAIRVAIPADEELHGFGGTEDSPAARGVVREMQLRVDLASESSTNELHVPVPLAIWPGRGLGAFAESFHPGAFDVGAARSDTLLVTFATTTLRVHLLGGSAFEILDRYTEVTGRPLVPPAWAFAPMQWRNVHRDTAQVLEDAQAIRDHDIPGSTIWIDNPWQTGYNTFEFDPARFPGAAGAIAQLGDLGFRVLVWSTPYVNESGATAADHDEATELGYLVTDDFGRPFDWPWQDGPGALVDFTRPGATEWWRERIARATDLGISGFKLDFGEDLVPELGGNRTPFRLAAGGTDVWHNRYAHVYHEAYLGALPEGDGFLLTRAGALGSQTVTTCVWPGDLDNDFSRHTPTHPGGLPAAISVGLSLSASGFPFYGSDIGGFRGGAPTAEALIRWSEYAALGTIMQLGGGGESHNPWDPSLYGAQALPIYRRYARLHTDLFPYLYSLATISGRTGRPITYAPGLIHPGHPYEDAFYSGDALFVAPVVDEGATMRTVTLPPGTWIDWWTGAPATGRITVPAPLDTLPLWRKAGEIVPMLAEEIDTLVPANTPGVVSIGDVTGELRAIVTPAAGAFRFELYDGGELSVTTDATSVTVAATAGTRHRRVRYEIDWANGPFPDERPSITELLEVADDAALRACPAPGCWRFDDAARWAFVRFVDLAPSGSVTLP